MRFHFNYQEFPGIKYTDKSEYEVEELEQSFLDFKIRLGAEYARIRISCGAVGDDCFEQFQNILPLEIREKQEMAMELIKTVRINTIKVSATEIVDIASGIGIMINLSSYDPDENDLYNYILK